VLVGLFSLNDKGSHGLCLNSQLKSLCDDDLELTWLCATWCRLL
jgi:hypothetical protein